MGKQTDLFYHVLIWLYLLLALGLSQGVGLLDLVVNALHGGFDHLVDREYPATLVPLLFRKESRAENRLPACEYPNCPGNAVLVLLFETGRYLLREVLVGEYVLHLHPGLGIVMEHLPKDLLQLFGEQVSLFHIDVLECELLAFVPFEDVQVLEFVHREEQVQQQRPQIPDYDRQEFLVSECLNIPFIHLWGLVFGAPYEIWLQAFGLGNVLDVDQTVQLPNVSYLDEVLRPDVLMPVPVRVERVNGFEDLVEYLQRLTLSYPGRLHVFWKVFLVRLSYEGE